MFKNDQPKWSHWNNLLLICFPTFPLPANHDNWKQPEEITLQVAFAIATLCQSRKVFAWLACVIIKADNCLAGERKKHKLQKGFTFVTAVTTAFCLGSTGSGVAISFFCHAFFSVSSSVKTSHLIKEQELEGGLTFFLFFFFFLFIFPCFLFSFFFSFHLFFFLFSIFIFFFSSSFFFFFRHLPTMGARKNKDKQGERGSKKAREASDVLHILSPFLCPVPQHYIAFQALGIGSLHCENSRKGSGGKERSKMP